MSWLCPKTSQWCSQCTLPCTCDAARVLPQQPLRAGWRCPNCGSGCSPDTAVCPTCQPVAPVTNCGGTSSWMRS